MNKSKRERLDNIIEKQDFEKAQELIDEYRKQYGEDIDIYPLEVELYVAMGEKHKAYCIAREAIKKNPYNIELNVMMREIAKSTNHMVEAMKYNVILSVLQNLRGEENLVDESLESLVIQQSEEIIQSGDRESIIKNQQEIDYYMEHLDTFFGLLDESL